MIDMNDEIQITEKFLEKEKIETVKALRFLLKEFGIKGRVETCLPKKVRRYFFGDRDYMAPSYSVRVILWGPIEPEIKEILKSFGLIPESVIIDYAVKVPKKQFVKIEAIVEKCFYEVCNECLPYRPYLRLFREKVERDFSKEKIPDMYATQAMYLLEDTLKISLSEQTQKDRVKPFDPISYLAL